MADTGRLIDTSDPTPTLTNNSYTMGVWIHEKLRLVRTLGIADLINSAGNRVSPSYESLLSAINDFSNDASVTDLINGSQLWTWKVRIRGLTLFLCNRCAGPGAQSWPMATYHQFILH